MSIVKDGRMKGTGREEEKEEGRRDAVCVNTGLTGRGDKNRKMCGQDVSFLRLA
jgi:hypothetical protein